MSADKASTQDFIDLLAGEPTLMASNGQCIDPKTARIPPVTITEEQAHYRLQANTSSSHFRKVMIEALAKTLPGQATLYEILALTEGIEQAVLSVWARLYPKTPKE